MDLMKKLEGILMERALEGMSLGELLYYALVECREEREVVGA